MIAPAGAAHVLLVDDDEDEGILIERLLRTSAPGDYAVEWTGSYATGQRMIEECVVQAALIDYHLGARNGLELIGCVSACRSPVPMILLADQGDRGVEAAALAAGATDYLDKGDLTGAALDRSLRYAIGRKRAAAALQSSEDRFRAIVEHAAEGLALLDVERRILFQSPAVTGILGYATADMHGRSLDAFLKVEDLATSRAMFDQAVRHPGEVVEGELTARHKDGTWRVLECSVVSRLHQAAVGAVVCNYRDVSRRRRADDALYAASRKFRAVFEGARDAMVIADDHSNLIAANTAALTLLGTSRERLLKEGVPSFAPALVARGEWASEPAAPGHSGDVIEVRRADGTLRAVEVSATPDILPGQHLTILRDVTERRNAERRVAEAQDRFSAIFANNPTAMFIYDSADGRITEANAEFERLTECRRTDALGHSSVELGLWADGDAAQAMLLGPQSVHDQDARMVGRSGSPRDVLVSIERLEVLAQADASRVALISDVTAMHGLEGQLRQSQKMDAVGQLAGGIAHDFNNLLTIIVGYAHMLAARVELSPEALDDANEIAKAGVTATALTQQLLAFSRRKVVQRAVVDVNALVDSTHALLARLVGDAIEMVVTLEPDLPRVVADPTLVEQCIMNLVVNARDAMPSGGRLSLDTASVTLDAAFLALHPGSTAGRQVMIAVSDTGVGMDALVRAHAFEPFFTTKPAGKGTGLGLSTVYGAVKQSGGFIDVESEPGHGSTFRIYLPASEQAATVPAAAACTELRGSESILLVDDQEGIRAFVEQVLRKNGYAVTTATGSKHALELLEGDHDAIDLLLTDIHMPFMSGRELAGAWRRGHPGLRVVYMSGNPDAQTEDGVVEQGVALIRKPFAGPALLECIRSVLDAP